MGRVVVSKGICEARAYEGGGGGAEIETLSAQRHVCWTRVSANQQLVIILMIKLTN